MKLNIRGKNLSVTPAIKEYIEKKLNKFFKGYDLSRLHHQLVLFGRYHCTAKKPKCKECKLNCKQF